MKVWVTHHYDYGDIHVYSERTYLPEVNWIKGELFHLEGGYEEERDQFLEDYKNARACGAGRAMIDERFEVELMEISNG